MRSRCSSGVALAVAQILRGDSGSRGRYPRAVTAHRVWLLFPFLLFVALLFVAPGCGGDDGGEAGGSGNEPSSTEDPEATSPGSGPAGESAEVRYLAIGDSLSQGIGADDSETGSFPARLAERWRKAGCTVELNNAGISGYTAGQMIDDQLPRIGEFGPNLITFQSGANDISNSVSEAEYRKNIGVVLDAAVASGARVFVLLQNEWFRAPDGPSYGGTRALRDAYDAIMIKEAGSRGVTVVDLRPIYKQQADDDEWVDDGIHPTEAAYDAWAEALAKMIPSPCKP